MGVAELPNWRQWLLDAPLSRGMTLLAGLGVALTATLFFVPAGAADIRLEQRRSTYEDMSPTTKAMQDDDMANPATLWVNDGEALWNAKVGAANKSCADCHGKATDSMTGVAARHPAFDAAADKPLDLEQRIQHCRETRQQAPTPAFESRELLALTAYVARQSRGVAITTGDDPRLAPFVAAGKRLFTQRRGQLNLSCAQCHDDNWGKHLAGALIPQAHPTGYPIYRLEWQALGSLQRRLRNCLIGVRAESYAYGSDEFVALELFLMARARGMAMEAPGVRP